MLPHSYPSQKDRVLVEQSYHGTKKKIIYQHVVFKILDFFNLLVAASVDCLHSRKSRTAPLDLAKSFLKKLNF